MADIKDYKWKQNNTNVKQFGEVYTPDNIVNDMLNLVDEKLFPPIPLYSRRTYRYKWEHEEYIKKTILEPSCGDGQFLIRILYRKMEHIVKPSKADNEWKIRQLLIALSTIYGVDIQEDKVIKARERMYHLAIGDTIKTFGAKDGKNDVQINIGIDFTDQIKDVIRYILETNIIVGNTLTGYVKNEDELKNLTDEEKEQYRLYLREFSFYGTTNNNGVKMKDFWLQPTGLSKDPDRTYNTVEWFSIRDARCKEEELTEEQKAHSKQLDEDIENYSF